MLSYQEWEGLKSQKFRDKGRKKFQLAAPEIVTPRYKFENQFTFPQQKQNEIQSLPQSQVTFTHKPNPNMVESTKLQRYYSEASPKAQFVPIQRKYDFERKHLRQNKYGHLEDLNYGIKTYEVANHETLDGFVVEDEMQRKVRVNNHRNGLGVHYLGDKAYHIPEYSPNFYKMPDGVIPGSNIQNRHQYLINL